MLQGEEALSKGYVWVTRAEDGFLWVDKNKPEKAVTMWLPKEERNGQVIQDKDGTYSTVRWEDTEPSLLKSFVGNKNKTLYIIDSEYDYSPVIIYLEGKEVLFEGDNEHSQGYTHYAVGFYKAYKMTTGKSLNMVEVNITEPEDLEKHKDLLNLTKSFAKYERFVSN